MPHSLGQVYVHLVLSTRDRAPFLSEETLRGDLHGYMTGIFRNLGCPSLRIGGGEDHVHVLFRLSRVLPIVQIVHEAKRGSSTWVRARGIRSFGWQNGHGAFSVSPQHVDKVIRYVKSQEKLHRRETFAEEYRRLLQSCDGLEQSVDIHLVFSTKNRLPLLDDRAVRQRLHVRLAEICEAVGCPSLRVGGIEDHVHLLYRLSQDQTLARVAQEVKKSSSAWLGSQWLTSYHRLMNFDWQEGYGAFSVSPQHVAATVRYIENQDEHHCRETFADECRRILGSDGRITELGNREKPLQPQSPG